MTFLQATPVAAMAPEQAGKTLDPLSLIAEASGIVQAVMALLVFMSVGCWFIAGAKWVRLRGAQRKTRRFLRSFWERDENESWSPKHLEDMYGASHSYTGSPVAAVFQAGYAELARLSRLPEPSANDSAMGHDIDNVDRALGRAATAEIAKLESNLPFLATTASTAPFIGLFGTVWGIMNTFLAIYGQKDTGLDVVLPGISEALIATAIGLAAAIPAVMVYNYFIRRLRLIETQMDAFRSDYLNVVRRHFLRS